MAVSKRKPLDLEEQSYSANAAIIRIMTMKRRLTGANRTLIVGSAFACLAAIAGPIVMHSMELNLIEAAPVPVWIVYSQLALLFGWFAIWSFLKNEADWLVCEGAIEALRNLEGRFSFEPVKKENTKTFYRDMQRLVDECVSGLQGPMRYRLSGKTSPLTQFYRLESSVGEVLDSEGDDEGDEDDAA